jgi:hypothetical protein
MKVIEFRYGQSSVVDVNAEFNPLTEILAVQATNLGKRRLRVRSVSILFGHSDGLHEIDTVPHEQLLNEGDTFVIPFARPRLVELANRANITAGDRSLLFAQIQIVGRPAVTRAIRLPANFEDASAGSYAPFIGANVFLDLGPNPPEHVHTGRAAR